jgi:4-hydroxy-3-polyprenylbenzoate decarboxylase
VSADADGGDDGQTPDTGVDSLREYLSLLETDGELTRIDEPISWNLEASAVTMLANQRDDRIPVFESVADADDRVRLVGDPYRGSRRRPWDRIAASLGMDRSIDSDRYYERVIDRLESPIEPERVRHRDAPCKRNIHTGDDVDLFEFPWPYIHAGDGGRYSNLHTLIAPAPDEEWADWSGHRTMIQDSNRASLLLLAGEQTPNLYYYKYERRDEPMPVALAVGAEPAVQYTSTMWIPTGRDEAEFAGGLKGAPVDLVECETNDLLVPANSEIVLEGRVLPDVRLDEGPFGDYFGYMHGPRRSMPVLTVDAITHRDDPIVPFCVEGSGVGHSRNTSTTLETACVGPDATLGLRAAGFDVRKLAPWQFTPRTVYTVATDVPRAGYLHELANFIFTTWGMLHVDFFVFVDPDVDPLDTRAVLSAIALHADPDEDFHQFGVETMPKVPLNIYQTPEEKGDAETGTSKSKTSKAYIDATRGPDAPDAPAYLEDEPLRQRARDVLAAAGVEPTRPVAPATRADGNGGNHQ